MEAFTPVGMARLAPSRGVFSGTPVVRISPKDILAGRYTVPGSSFVGHTIEQMVRHGSNYTRMYDTQGCLLRRQA